MNYDDFYLLKLIKKLNERLGLVESRLGSLITTINNSGTGSVLRGHGVPAGASPGTSGTLYYDLDTGVLYEQAEDGSWSLL